MNLSNYHSHCTFCDGRSPMEDFVKFAIANGIKKYGFSSHAPLPFLTPWTMLADEFDDYESEFKRLKDKYKSEIELYIGLEVDYIHGYSDIRNDFFKNKQLDFTIGSIHYLDKISDNKYWTIDGGFDEFDEGLKLLYGGDIRMATKRFFEISAFMIEKGGFDIVGHFDKITYHGLKYKDFSCTDTWFVTLVTEVLELIRDKGLILEINTKSLHDHGITFPHQQFYKTIHEMKIPIVVNSDCHYPTKITAGFEPTYKALKEAGFSTVHQLFDGEWKAVEIHRQWMGR